MRTNRILVLPESVKRQIAAGEVVEGPFSVVKEAMENSIDAGATVIDVEVEESGLKKILVRDNGAGIYRGELPLAVAEHATSKIKELDDIHGILTYGFRGEALSSISAISKLTLLSRSGEEESGGRILCREGRVEQSEYAGPGGTTLIVENLFYNTPARKKFLKSRTSEMKSIRSVFLRTALVHFYTAFTLSGDGKRIFTLTAADTLEERIEQIFGRETMEGLLFNSLQDIRVGIKGYLSRPDFLKNSRSLQFMYVNNRPVEYKYLGYLLSRAYEGILPSGKHPAAILLVTVEPELIDVNVHPAKREIKFFDHRYIESLILSLCRKALGERVHGMGDRYGSLIMENDPDSVSAEKKVLPYEMDVRREFPERVLGEEGDSGPAESVLPGLRSVINDAAMLYRHATVWSKKQVLGLVLDHYILVQDADSLIFLDFHAVHERIIYDELMSNNEQVAVQQLIFPQELELPAESHQVLRENYTMLHQIGFDIEDFSDSSIIVRGVPAAAREVDVKRFMEDLAQSLIDETYDVTGTRTVIARQAACHSAKRTGDSLSPSDMVGLVEQALSGAHELRCPHGRPFLYRLGRNDLDRIFKRS